MSNNPVQFHTGTVVDGVQKQAEVLMARHTPDTWPTLNEGLSQWEAITKSMDAKDFDLPIKHIAMNHTTGGLFNSTKGNGINAITPTHTALAHLVSYTNDAPSAAVENLESYPPTIRAQMLAHLIAKTEARKVFLRTAVKGVTQPDGWNGNTGEKVPMVQERVIRAVVSEKHSKDHGDDLQLISKLRGLNLPGARLRVVKEWDYTHAEVVIPNKVVEVKPGVIIQARINIKNSETKGGSLEASIGSLNLACVNGMVSQGNGTNISIRHVGNISYKMLAAVTTVVQLADDHLHEFSQAYKDALPVTRAAAIEATVRRYKLPETTGAALATLWDVDGERGAGNTVAGLANALTRAAQAMPVEKALELETIAGKVISRGLEAFV